MAEPARCVWCKVAVEGQFALGAPCPHCGRAPLLLEPIPEVRQEHSYGNKPEKDPDLIGPGGRAWLVTDVPDGDQSATVGSDWLVHAPQAHPFWWWYVVCVIHLRPLAGQAPAHVRFPGATHEVMTVALNPERPLPSLDNWKSPAYLTPPDLAEQFVVPSDAHAKELGDLLVRHMVLDGASPDSDFRSYWQGTVAKTAEHMRLGGHPDQEAES